MLELKALTCGYGLEPVIMDVNLTLKPGGITAIIGPNGAGKTTLLRAIGRIIEAQGEITYNGSRLNSLSRKECSQKIALLSQTENHYFHYAVEEILLMGRFPHLPRSYNSYRREDFDRVEAVIEELGLEKLRKKNVLTLSGGQKQRVLLGRALVQDPDILLLDEPTNHLDLAHQLQLLSYVKDWAKRQEKIVVAVLHDFNVVMRYADDVVLLDQGRLIMHGGVQKVLGHPGLQAVYGVDIPAYMRASLDAWAVC